MGRMLAALRSALLGSASSAHRSRPRAAPFRRVVTGFDASGRSIITSDGPVPERERRPWSEKALARMPFLRLVSRSGLWVLPAVPADLAETRDPLGDELRSYGRAGGLQPPRGAVTADIFRFEPGGGHPMHTTATVDLIVVVSGAMELVMESGSTVVRAGDVVVQRGTPHAWRVVGDEPCVFVAVLVDALGSPVAPERLMR
jgi:quercetin dioxygenase-like cupin family protein